MTDFETGQKNLLKLAEILDTADAEHRKRGELTYDQNKVTHGYGCKTPSCAMGHWIARKTNRQGETIYEISEKDFCTTSSSEYWELFGLRGCGNAKTAKQAAKYIRQFVKRRARTGDRT